MKPIREQLREQAESIREAWARTPNATGHPRYTTITLEFASPCYPAGTTGCVNSSDACGVPAGYLLSTSVAAMGKAAAYDVIVRLAYREVPWNHRVLVEAATTPGAKPKILVDPSGPPAYPSADFDGWLDALEPPCQRPGEESPSDSWRDRSSLL